MTKFATAASINGDTETATRACLNQLSGTIEPSNVDFVWIGISPAHQYEEALGLLQSATGDATIIGASSAGEFTEDGVVSGGMSVAAVASDSMAFSAGLGTGYGSDPQAAVGSAVGSLDTDIQEAYPYAVGLNFHDGLVGNGDEVTMRGYQAIPTDFVGGSAGDDRRLEETAVFVGDQVSTDGVALGVIGSEQPFQQAVGHGHKRISDGMTVTDSDGGTVRTLDGEPAYERWADAVRDVVEEEYEFSLSGIDSGDPEWVQLLTRFEFGIETGDQEYKIRWPGITPDRSGPLSFATVIPEGTDLFVMDAQPADEREAQRRVGDSLDGDLAGVLSFACICQSNILGDEFGGAVQAFGDQVDAPLAGMEVYGEVGLSSGDMRGYHNASLSVLGFPSD
jgi:methyl-accepting chemotaxis protein